MPPRIFFVFSMPPLTHVTLGTRGSELALAQAALTEAALAEAWPELQVARTIVKTTGDLRPDLKLSEFNRGPNPVDKGIFTRELEQALQEQRIDFAVHSLKDVPTELAAGFRIVAVLPRAPVEDVLVTKSPGGLATLPAGALVATSSVRRARQLRLLRPDLRVEDIRGNVPTRLTKLAHRPDLAGLLLARAGLQRLGLHAGELPFQDTLLHQETLSADRFLPAASQGAVAFEIFGENPALEEILHRINHVQTFLCITAERHFLHLLQAGCQTPVGLHSALDGPALHMKTIVFSEQNPEEPPVRAEASGNAGNPHAVAERLFAQVADQTSARRAHPAGLD